MTANTDTLVKARLELKALRSRPDWQYAFGAHAAVDHPAIKSIRDEDARLLALIEEHRHV